ncbi:MAG: hypothetical protein QME81_18445, partial [bacterium]|nr:hypothetical protein [bacterium]
MLIIRSRNSVPIRLTQERWQHILHRHPEMETQCERVLETVAGPDIILPRNICVVRENVTIA